MTGTESVGDSDAGRNWKPLVNDTRNGLDELVSSVLICGVVGISPIQLKTLLESSTFCGVNKSVIGSISATGATSLDSIASVVFSATFFLIRPNRELTEQLEGMKIDWDVGRTAGVDASHGVSISAAGESLTSSSLHSVRIIGGGDDFFASLGGHTRNGESSTCISFFSELTD